MDTSTCWKSVLSERLPLLGHRNWIVVADAAYPSQTSPGIQTLATGQTHEDVLSHVLQQIDQSPHVRPIVHLDKEIDLLDEAAAPGIDTLRRFLDTSLNAFPVSKRLHEDIIADLDAAGETFDILLLKTNMVLPYTTVFLQLDCGYWDEASEHALRSTMTAAT
ncbi:hypothetical protein [Crateriforma conspicua]|uniref:D-ribose pyranase n=1 Tax=Crateriforma conspicua TaxID=2527996 RepID=A0A5C5XS98_9PLAN|nr:hypothetical protein [Crateriforma conspicua]QDV66143.1 hypothetical protein Mal65_53170 [Crateriforma conspicua]TWT65528.1 hypothetical protein Pan14r_50740 [Crateriforma conspicua]